MISQVAEAVVSLFQLDSYQKNEHCHHHQILFLPLFFFFFLEMSLHAELTADVFVLAVP